MSNTETINAPAPSCAVAAGTLAPIDPSAITTLRLTLLERGYAPLPLQGKRPVIGDWQSRTISADDVTAWQRLRDARNTGVRCGSVIGIDIDVPDAELADTIGRECGRIVGANSLRRIGNAPKLLIPYRVAEPLRKSATERHTLPNGATARVEVLAEGQQFVAYGTHPDTGRPYEWHGGSLDAVPLAALPVATPEHVRRFLDRAEALLARAAGSGEASERGAKAAPPANPPTVPQAAPHAAWPPPTREEVEAALACVPNDDTWDAWHRVGAALWDACGDGGFALFDAWSRQSHKYDARETARKWRSYATSPSTVHAATLFYLARANGWRPERRALSARTPHGAETARLDGQAPERADVAPTGLTEDGVALAFASEYRGKLLFDHDSGRWLEWSGAHWRECRTPQAFHYARELSRCIAALWPSKKGTAPSRAAFAAAVERFAAADPTFARHSGDFDRDPWLLATPGGTVDLRTGILRPADPADMISRCASVAPAERADCPRWHRFLDDATRGDAELIAYLQRFAGYCLTGLTTEHVLMFVYGTGKNGKTTFVGALQHALGDHAVVAPAEVFAASHHDRHPTELAMLRSARLVVASETEEGRAWAESRVKALTGGDPITARFMRKDFFTFVPTFKLLIVGNHKPVLRNVDEAMRRRIHIVPFLHKPPQPDPNLGEALRAEAPGILRWMIEGCLEWQRGGLAPPAVVRAATEEYLSDQDVFATWAAERLVFGPDLSERPGALLSDFNTWAVRHGEAQRSRHALAAWVDRRPELSKRTLRGALFVRGVALRREDDR